VSESPIPVYEIPSESSVYELPSQSPSYEIPSESPIQQYEIPSESPIQQYEIYPEADQLRAANLNQEATARTEDAAPGVSVSSRNIAFGVGACVFVSLGMVGAVVFVKRRRSSAKVAGTKAVRDEEYDGSRNVSMPKIAAQAGKGAQATKNKPLLKVAPGRATPSTLDDSVASLNTSRKLDTTRERR